MDTPDTPPTLDELVRDPARAGELPPETARDLLGRLAALQPVLLTRALQSGPGDHGPPKSLPGDQLLTAAEVARRLGLSADTVYRRRWPFEVRPTGKRARRFSAQGLDMYLRRQHGR